MNLEREYTQAALDAVGDWLYLLPTDVQRKVRLASSLLATYGDATAEEVSRELGGRNWVIARRTRNIVAEYGEDVICVSPKRYDKAVRDAIERRVK